MLKKILILWILLVLYCIDVNSQSHFPGYFSINFSDKNLTIYSIQHPENFLSPKSIERKNRHGIEINQDDFPVNSWYIDSLISKNLKVIYTSRWMNSVLVEVKDSMDLEEVLKLDFVSQYKYLGPFDVSNKNIAENNDFDDEKKINRKKIQSGLAYQQLELIGVRALQQLGFMGEGITIALMDAGFSGLDKMKAFEEIFEQNRILGTYDFVKQSSGVYAESTHGTYCFSTIAGNIKDKYLGSAPSAFFYLFRTEITSSEYPVEEFYWLIAAEMADSLGVDIISTSLGYNTFNDPGLNYTISQLDGKTSMISKAAQKAADKGLLIINSAGNEGQSDWRKISFPADVKDLISVGAVNTRGEYASFSSVGNSADGRIKPDLVCVGQNTILINTEDVLFKGNGTSFAAPTLAGATALLVQACPSKKPEEIRLALQKSGSQYLKPDSVLGYGIPNVFLAYLILNGQKIPELYQEETFQLLPNPFNDEIFIYFSSNSIQSLKCSLYNLNGKSIKDLGNINPVIGNNIFRLTGLQSVQAGVYVLILANDEKVISKKLIKAE